MLRVRVSKLGCAGLCHCPHQILRSQDLGKGSLPGDRAALARERPLSAEGCQ